MPVLPLSEPSLARNRCFRAQFQNSKNDQEVPLKAARFLTGAAIAALLIGAPALLTSALAQPSGSGASNPSASSGGASSSGSSTAAPSSPSPSSPVGGNERSSGSAPGSSIATPSSSSPSSRPTPGSEQGSGSAATASGSSPGAASTHRAETRATMGSSSRPPSVADPASRTREQPGMRGQNREEAAAVSGSGGSHPGGVSVPEFRERLEPQGQFVQVQGLGGAWKPRDVPADWTPYSKGHWIFNQQVGWFWESDEPWGEIVFHYGRWDQDADQGWVWVADTQWAPAWGGWRRSKKALRRPPGP